jgi:hypothetical protein
MHRNEEIKEFLNMYISCDVSLLPIHCKMYNNINARVHVGKKNVVYRFHYPLPVMCETKISKPFQIDGNYPFSQQYLHTQAKNIFQSLKHFFKNEDISQVALNVLKLDSFNIM